VFECDHTPPVPFFPYHDLYAAESPGGTKNAALSFRHNGRYINQSLGLNPSPQAREQRFHIMALKITLKPNEKMIIGGAVIKNGPGKCEFIVENNVPILRQNSILSPDEADTPARRIYLAIQLMYVDTPNIGNYRELYWKLIRQFVQAAPSSLELVDRINEMIFQENYYQALKSAQDLIAFEEEVIQRVTKCSEILTVG
jgi:flagellar protein FlbT